MIGTYGLAEYHLGQARRFLARQSYNEALPELEVAARFRPWSSELQLLAGRTARQGGNFSTAWEHLHRCRELQGGVSAELQLEESLLRAQTGELEEVFSFLLPHLSQDTAQTPLVLETLSHAYLFLFRFDNAWQCLERWLTLQPDNVEALFLRGNYYSLVGNQELAEKDLHRTLELDPQRIPARLLLAQTLLEQHHAKEAAREFGMVVQQDSTNVKARLGLASCYVELRDWSGVESMLQGCPADSSGNPEAAYLRGRLAEGQTHYAEAIPYFQKALALRPSDNTSCYHLVLCSQHIGDEASASRYQDILERIESDQRLLLVLTNEEKKSLPSNPKLCCELGEVCLRLGIQRRGLHWLQAALYLDPQFPRAHEQLLRYYEQLGSEGEQDAAFHRLRLRQITASLSKPGESSRRQPLVTPQRAP